MATYRTFVLSTIPCVRSHIISTLTRTTEHREGSTLYQVGGDPTAAVEVRDDDTLGTPLPTPLPSGWDVISPSSDASSA